MKQTAVEVKKNETEQTYDIDLSRIDVSIPEAISILRKLKKDGKATIKEVEKDGKIFWIMEY